MTRFSLTGKLRNGKRVTITWHDGALSGTDEQAVAAVQTLAQAYQGRPVRKLPAAATLRNHLDSPYSAYALIEMIFPEPRTLKLRGHVPPLGADLPDGAVM